MLGFFSPEIDQFRNAIRNSRACKPWFNFADDLNRFGFEMLRGHAIWREDNQRFSISLFFIRAHQSFQAAVILTERGMIGDARTALRSATEGAIALHALAADATFVDRLVAAHRKHQLTMARELLENPDYRSNCTSEQLKKLALTKTKIERLKGQHPQEAKNINWADVAKEYCNDLYHLLYRPLSADGTHATVDSINRHVQADDPMEITALKVAPHATDTAAIVDTLSTACLVFFWAADPFVRIFDRNDHASRIQKHLARFRELEPKIALAI